MSAPCARVSKRHSSSLGLQREPSCPSASPTSNVGGQGQALFQTQPAEQLRHAFQLLTALRPETRPTQQEALVQSRADGLVVMVAVPSKTPDMTMTAVLPIAMRGPRVTVQLREVVRVLKALGCASVELTTDARGLVMQAGGSRTLRVPGAETTEQPSLPVAPQVTTVPAAVLAEVLGATTYALSLDGTRPQLQSLLVEVEGQELIATATDGHRLAQATTSCAQCKPGGTALVRGPAALALQRICREAGRKNKSAPVTIHMNEQCVSFGTTLGTTRITLTARPPEATFPDYRQVIPQGEGTTQLEVDRAELLSAAQAIQAAGPGAVRLNMHDGCVLSGNGAEIRLGTGHTGSKLVVEVEAKYLIQALEAAYGPTVRLHFWGELDPIRIASCSPSGMRALNVTMPRRLK